MAELNKLPLPVKLIGAIFLIGGAAMWIYTYKSNRSSQLGAAANANRLQS